MIIFVSGAPFFGGAEYQILDLISSLKKEFPTKFVTSEKSPFKKAMEKAGVETEIVSLGSTFGRYRGLNFFNPVNLLLQKKMAEKLASATKKDLVITFDYKELVLVERVKKGFSHLHIQHPQFPAWLRKNPLLKKAVVAKLNSCEQVVVDCQALKKYLADFSVSEEKIKVVYNGVDEHFFVPPRQEQKLTAKKKLGLEKKPVIGINARINAGKGYETLLEALVEVKRKIPEVHLLSVGGGNKLMEKKIRNKVKYLGLLKEVTFLGKIEREETLNFYYAADVFTLPSESEGLPLSVLEAIFTHVPVVATKVGGIPEEIEEGKSGWLCEAKDSRALAKALLEALDDKIKVEKFTQEAYSSALEKFTKSRMIEESGKLIREVLGKEGRSK
ncbi:MAG: glycosyltransferase family 4 protein [bacterium]|nr:glycosyltransferase family 4 protein [bacterium]